jgi:hypothetical protein
MAMDRDCATLAYTYPFTAGCRLRNFHFLIHWISTTELKSPVRFALKIVHRPRYALMGEKLVRVRCGACGMQMKLGQFSLATAVWRRGGLDQLFSKQYTTEWNALNCLRWTRHKPTIYQYRIETIVLLVQSDMHAKSKSGDFFKLFDLLL